MGYAAPTRLDSALEIMASQRPTPIAGGTDFFPARVGQAVSEPVLDLSGVPELHGITESDEGLRIGATTTWTDIATASLPAGAGALREAALQIGGVQVQNAGTIGGNLCNSSPAADGVPPLLTMDAEVELASTSGTRRMPLTEFLVDYRTTALADEELLVAVHLPGAAVRGSSAFLKLGSRTHLVISIAMVAVRLVVDDEHVTEAAIAVGACSPVAVRLEALERELIGSPVSHLPSLPQAEHLRSLSPIDDPRAPADYRSRAALVLVRRAIERCVART